MKLLYAIIAFCLLISYTPFSQTISSNAPLCGNANLTLELSATGGTTYAWKGPNSFTSTQQKPSIKSVNYRNRGVYTVIVDNKTTLTTDVNIKDPVAFTVPKEISVCEGGTLIIEPKKGRLTDSTEVPNFFRMTSTWGNRLQNGILTNFGRNDNGFCEVTSIGDGCWITQSVRVTLNTNSNCKKIEVEDITKIKMCYGQEVVVPFTTKGDFKVGTKFKAYIFRLNSLSNNFDNPIAIVEKSPFIIKNVDKYFDQTIAIVVVADDVEKTTAISNYKYFYNHRFSMNSVQSCDSSNLSVNNYNFKIDGLQWFFNGNPINGATNNRFTAKTTGTYSFKYSGNATSNEIDKTCLYESQPVKIELGKIEKPYVYVSNDIELCVGKPATLNVYSNNNPTYRWKKDGNYIANATNKTYETVQEGKYQIEAKEGTCTAVSDTVVLRKGQDFVDSFIIPMATGSTMIFDSLNRVYKACNTQVFDLSIFGVPKNSKYQWFKNNELLKDTLDVIKNIKGEGRYFTRIRYGQCEVISKSIDIKYSNSVKIPIYNKNIEKCEGTSANLFFYTYFNNTKLGEGNIYRDGVKIQDWRLWGNNYYINNLTVDKSGNYYAMGKALLSDGSECIIRTDTVKINFLKKIQLTSYGFDSKLGFVPISSCDNTTAVPRWDYGNGSIIEGRETSFKWTKDGITLKQDSLSILQATQSGTYQLETAYKGGCTVVSSPYKVEFGKIDVGISENALICENQKYQIYPIIDDNSLNTFDLYKDGKILKINTSKYGTFITEEGRYKIVITNGKCEGTSPDFTLKVDKIPTSITPSDSVTFCAGKTVELKTSTEAGLSYIWERNGSVISQANQANYTANADGLYKATLLRGACWGTTPSVKLKSLANITSTATLTGDKKIDYDTETKLSINLTSHAPWTFKLSDGKEYTATKSPFEVSVKPLSTTTYSVSEVKNICGTGTVSGSAKIEIIILSAEEEKELKVEIYPVPSSEICHWKIETPQATNVSVLLYDVLGITQYSQASSTRTQTHEGTIDLTNMKAGTYFLKLQAGEKSVVRKVVKF